MKKMLIVWLTVILLLLTACDGNLHISQEYAIIDREDVEDVTWVRPWWSSYYCLIYGWTVDKLIVDIYSGIMGNAYNYKIYDDIGEGYEIHYKDTLENYDCITALDKLAKIHHTQRLSFNKLYTVHIITDQFTLVDHAELPSLPYIYTYVGTTYVYTFFEYDFAAGCWKKTGDIYEVSGEYNHEHNGRTSGFTEKSDYDGLKVGDSLKEVVEIDSSQRLAFHYKRMVQDEFESHHLTKEGMLTIKYELDGELGYETLTSELKIKSMEWSELPILEQDLPK